MKKLNMKTKYFKNRTTYFNFIDKYRNKFDYIKIIFIKNKIKVIYNLK